MTSNEPTRDRPVMPDGYGTPETDDGLLEWSWAVERLEKARNFWFSTTRPDGRPHAMPAWGVWMDGAVYFEGSPETRRARNIAKNPHVVIHLEDAEQVVILEGEAVAAHPPGQELGQRLAAVFAEKFGASHDYRPAADSWDAGGLWRLQPKIAFGWTEFPKTVTRWRFE